MNYEQYRITTGEQSYCIKCGATAEFERYGYVWCEEHKQHLDDDPEELENMVIDRMKEEK